MKKYLSLILALMLVLGLSATAFAEEGSTTLTTTIPCTVTLQVGEHGKVTVDDVDYTGDDSFQRDAGTVVTYTFTPSGLYSVDKVIYDGVEVTDELTDNTFTAPALTGNAALSVSFKLIGGGTPTYTVTFDANGHGTAPDAQTVLSGNTATEPAALTAEGWVFGGWFEDETCTVAFDFATPITADITLYAKWTKEGTTPTPTYYIVTFDENGHGVAPDPQTVEKGKTARRPADPTAKGWEFVGWYTDRFGFNAFDFTTPITRNITLYARWVREGTTPTPTFYFTVTFDANGHGTAPAPQTVLAGGKAREPAPPTESGWIFGGWYREKECRNAFDFSVPLTQNVTLYAKWTEVVTPPPPVTVYYTVTFDANGHGTAPVPQRVESGKTAAKPSDPTAEGWEFGGWYKEAACTNAFSFYTPITGNITLYAKWTQSTAGKPESPKTGDDSNLGLWLGLSAFSAAGLIGLGVYGGKRRKKAE